MTDVNMALYAGQIHSILAIVIDAPETLENKDFHDAVDKVLLNAPNAVLMVSTARLMDLRNRLDANKK
jgi:hypothetical protein